MGLVLDAKWTQFNLFHSVEVQEVGFKARVIVISSVHCTCIRSQQIVYICTKETHVPSLIIYLHRHEDVSLQNFVSVGLTLGVLPDPSTNLGESKPMVVTSSARVAALG